jgi:glycosyltransferase involved in cell wall biosynthesis
MAQENYPKDPLTWQSYARIERDTVQHARFSIFTTPGAAAMYRERYSTLSAERFQIVENGYDEESFANLDETTSRQPLNPGLVTLLHSGALYASERDPTHLFLALGSLKRSGHVTARRLRLRFRASGQDDLLKTLARQNEVEDLIELADAVAYQAALEEMILADGLLLMQAANCNQQIPAKLYEYLRAGKPILALTDSRGDTAGALRSAGAGVIAGLDSAMEIERTLLQFLEAIEAGCAKAPDIESARRNARHVRAGELARLLEESCRTR